MICIAREKAKKANSSSEQGGAPSVPAPAPATAPVAAQAPAAPGNSTGAPAVPVGVKVPSRP